MPGAPCKLQQIWWEYDNELSRRQTIAPTPKIWREKTMEACAEGMEKRRLFLAVSCFDLASLIE